MNSSRPPLLIILIICGLAGCFLNMFMVISPPARNVAHWYPLYLSLSTLYALICLGGMGSMKKWGVIAYSFYALAQQGVYLFLGTWDAHALVLPAAITIVGWIYYRKMS